MASSQKITADLQQHIGTHSAELIEGIYQEFDAWNDARIIPNVKNTITLTSLQINSILKPFTTTFAATVDAIEFKARTMSIHTGKAELTVVPEDYRATYLAQWQKPGMTRTPEDLPFEQYIMEEIIKRIQQDLNNITAYNGVRNAAGTGAIDVTNGWKTQLAAIITAGDVVPVTQTAWTSSNAFTNMKALWRTVPEKYRQKSLNQVAFMSQATYEKITDQLEASNSYTGTGDQFDGPKYLKGTDKMLEIRPVSWMAGSARVFITPAENLCILTDSTNEDMNTISVLQSHYTADLMVTLAIGFDFATNMIWCNELA